MQLYPVRNLWKDYAKRNVLVTENVKKAIFTFTEISQWGGGFT